MSSNVEIPLIALSDSDSPTIINVPQSLSAVRKRKRTKTKRVNVEKSPYNVVSTTEVLSNSFMLSCRIPAEESGWQWRWRPPPDISSSSDSDEDSSLASSEAEFTTRRHPPKKKLRRMGEMMSLKRHKKLLTQDPYPLAKDTTANLETLNKQLDSLQTRIKPNPIRLLNNSISPVKEFTSLNATSTKNGSTSNTKINEMQIISTPINNTRDNVSTTRTFKLLEIDDDVTIIEDVAQNKGTLPVMALNMDKEKNKASTSKDVDVVSSDDDIIVLDIPRLIPKDNKHLRPIIIDGNSVALEHGIIQNTYSCKGIKICVDFFLKRGHTQIVVFVPDSRKSRNFELFPTTDNTIIKDLARSGRLFVTPSRTSDERFNSNNRFIVELAAKSGGVILSNDKYINLVGKSDSYKKAIEERLLMFHFVGDMLMIPNDPLGLQGPCLEEFLSFPKHKKSST